MQHGEHATALHRPHTPHPQPLHACRGLSWPLQPAGATPIALAMHTGCIMASQSDWSRSGKLSYVSQLRPWPEPLPMAFRLARSDAGVTENKCSCRTLLSSSQGPFWVPMSDPSRISAHFRPRHELHTCGFAPKRTIKQTLLQKATIASERVA